MLTEQKHLVLFAFREKNVGALSQLKSSQWRWMGWMDGWMVRQVGAWMDGWMCKGNMCTQMF